jgi:cation-transporting ATPase G
MSDACCNDEPGTSSSAHGADDEHEPHRLSQIRELQLSAAAGVLLAAGLIAGWAGTGPAVVLALEVAALLLGAYTFVPGAVRRLLKGKIGVGTLMTIAAIGAVLLGQFFEAAMLAFLYSISEGLEEYSLARARRGLRALLSLVPAQATVIRDNREDSIAPAELRLGDVMLVRAGERVATDGVVRSGHSTLDVSAITGESVPVEVGVGADIFAGSINGSGVIEVRVTAAAEDNSLARIVRIVEAEQARKGASQRLADRIAKPLVPGIMVLAAAIAAIGSLVGDPLVWIERALVVLVAASPCALAISVPVTVFAAVGAASRIGVLVKGGAALETLGTVRIVALDKTGTLTRNRPTVIDIATACGATRAQVLAAAAALESRSEHPLARAILSTVDEPRPAKDVQTIPGAGLTVRLDEQTVRLGRPGWLDAGPLVADVRRMQEAGATAVLVEVENQVIGAIAVRDELRPEASEVVAHLRRAGQQVVMLTGDNAATARALAREAGIETVHCDLRPEDKSRIVAELRARQTTAMVGDGVNDAPVTRHGRPRHRHGGHGHRRRHRNRRRGTHGRGSAPPPAGV